MFQTILVRRRAVLGGIAAALGLPSGAQAQQPSGPAIGFLSSRSENDSRYLVAAFRKGLNEGGFVEGRDVEILYRWADGQYGRLPAMAADLAARNVVLLVAVGGEPSALAAKAAAPALPLVFTTGGDPIKVGLVQSLNRPGGNATGYSLMSITPEAKRLELINDLVPASGVIAALIDPNYQEAAHQEQELEKAASAFQKQLLIAKAGNGSELNTAFEVLERQRPSALVVTGDPFFDTQRDKIISFANQQHMPAVYQFREYALAGGLMSYGISLTEGYRGVGSYVAKILKGAKPAELPVVQSIKFELVINAKTARDLGIHLPPLLLARADEVIE